MWQYGSSSSCQNFEFARKKNKRKKKIEKNERLQMSDLRFIRQEVSNIQAYAGICI
jgi:hypothetical protein